MRGHWSSLGKRARNYLLAVIIVIVLDRFLLYLFSLAYTPRTLAAELLLNIVAILLIAASALILHAIVHAFLELNTVRLRSSDISPVARLRGTASQYTDTIRFAKAVLEVVDEVLGCHDSQLTLYYDLPIAMEVTHVRRCNGSYQTRVQRIREDDVAILADDSEFLSPLTSVHSEMLTYRDRLVGMLLLGPGEDQFQMDRRKQALLEELSGAISTTADNVIMIRSVTEANQKLFENEKLASIGQLASGIAHEIRNPLSSVKMNLQGLNRGEKLSDRDQRRVQISLDEIERLDNIIGELMSFARRTHLQLTSLSPIAIIDKCLERARAEIKTKQITVRKMIPDDLPQIEVDEDRIVRTLLNLILNAVQAMEEEGTLILRVEAYSAGVEIQVQDNGPGIPESLVRDIFNPFFTTKADGTGLGLANALKYVQEHSGELECISAEGKGATFILRLPFHPPEKNEDPSALRVVPR